MTTPAELFDQISALLYAYCDASAVVIHVEMAFDREPFELTVVRHIRDPNNLFDTSRDAKLELPEDQRAAIRTKAAAYFAIASGWPDRLLNTTLSIYQDGQWSVSSSSQTT